MGEWPEEALPWDGTLKDFFTLKSDNQVLMSSIQVIVLTRKGELPMQPEFGSEVPDMLFEPNEAGNVGGVESAIRGALRRWDDRIEVNRVEVDIKEHTVDCHVRFKAARDPSQEVRSIRLDLGTVV